LFGFAHGSFCEQTRETLSELLQPDLQVTARAAPWLRTTVLLVHTPVLVNDLFELDL